MYLKALEQLQQEGYPAHVVVENLLHPERYATYVCVLLHG